jgi:hypothetical protein
VIGGSGPREREIHNNILRSFIAAVFNGQTLLELIISIVWCLLTFLFVIIEAQSKAEAC